VTEPAEQRAGAFPVLTRAQVARPAWRDPRGATARDMEDGEVLAEPGEAGAAPACIPT